LDYVKNAGKKSHLRDGSECSGNETSSFPSATTVHTMASYTLAV